MNPDALPNEQNIVNTPEQADNAAMTELSHEQPVEETVVEAPAAAEGESDNTDSRPADRQEIIQCSFGTDLTSVKDDDPVTDIFNIAE